MPQEDDKVVIEISHLGQVRMLANGNCKAKSIHDVPAPHNNVNEESSSGEDSDHSYMEERKFGAAETFRYSDDADATRTVE